MERQAKQRKLNARRRAWPHVSASALAAILRSCKEEGVPEGGLGRNELRAAREMEMNEATPYGPIASSMTVHAKDRTSMTIPVANPFAYLWKAVKQSPGFARLLEQRCLEQPPSVDAPWHLVVYSDGVTPGDALTPLNRRKFQICYWSLLELGVNALSREECWFIATTEFETVLSNVSAGLSQLFGSVIKTFFDPDGFNLAAGGMTLPFESGEQRLFAKLSIVLQDGGAHKQVWHSRGDGATRLCMLCKNLVTDASGMAQHSGLLKANVIKWNDLVGATGQELRQSAMFLAAKAGTMSEQAFTELQQSLGMTHQQHGILLDRTLDSVFDPTEVFNHDWMHCLFVDGCFNLIVFLLLEAFINTGYTDVYQVCANYVSKFRWPRWVHGAHLHEIFAQSRKDKHRKARHIKAQASDLLSLVPVLALFTQNVLFKLGTCNKECAAFLSLVEVIELVKSVGRVSVTPDRMLKAVEHCLACCADTFGFEELTPKWHWMLHFHQQLTRNRVMLNCFCLERKHRAPKRYCTEFKSVTATSSKFLLNEVVAHHLGQLSKPGALCFDVGLVDGRPMSKRMSRELMEDMALEGEPHLRTAATSRFSALAAAACGDVVLVKDEGGRFRAGKVDLHCEVNGEPLSLISLYVLEKHVASSGFAVWQVGDDGAQVTPTGWILDTVVYSVWENNRICTLLPMEYR